MKKGIFVFVLFVACISGCTADAATADALVIRKLLDNWAKSLHDRNLDGIMAMYAPGNELTAFDVEPPLRYVGFEAYRKDYRNFLSQYRGPIDVELRDLVVVADGSVAYSYGLEKLSGVLKNGQKSSMWSRFTSCFRKVNGHWYDVHDHVSVPSDLDRGIALTGLSP